MDEEANPLERDHSLSVVLPGGLEKNATVHGSKPVMDLLVTLCASYHLNPSDYTVEVLSPNKNNISFKPNSPIGSLEAEKIVLKPKGMEEKIRRPYMPEASVRLLINYNKSHKAVVRVNPRAPLELLLPVVCDKLEFHVRSTVLLRDAQSREPLDLSKSLNEHGLREVFAKDTAEHQPVTPTLVISPPPLQELPKKEKKQKENKGFLSLFRRRKKKAEKKGPPGSAPGSPGPSEHVAGLRVNAQGGSCSNTLPMDMPKKRRAPQPPMGASLSVPNNIGACHGGGSQRSAESTLRSTKRRAPPPPGANPHQELLSEVKDALRSVDELTESDESDYANVSLSSSSSPRPRSSHSFAHLHEMADQYLPSGKDLSDARCALAKVLTSSISKGALVKRLRSSATFQMFNGSSSSSVGSRRCSDDEVFGAEVESVPTSELPAEPEWEDPVERKGLTTFKVVPAKRQQSPDPEVAAEEEPEREASPETEDPCPPKTETPSQSPEPSSSSPPLDLDIQESPGSPLCEVGDAVEEQTDEAEVPEVTLSTPSDCGDGEGSDVHTEEQEAEEEVEEEVVQEEEEEEEVEEEVVQEEEEDCFPPPPPPVFFDTAVTEEEREDATPSSLPSSQSPTSNGAFSEDGQNDPETNEAPSRFAQAVALAVQRSRLQSGGKASGPQAPGGPPRSTYQYGA